MMALTTRVAARGSPNSTWWTDEARSRGILATGVWPYLPSRDGALCRGACRAWYAWFDAADGQERPHHHPLRTLSAEETEGVCERLRRLRLPWSEALQAYIVHALSSVPCVQGPEGISEVQHCVERLLSRAYIAPKSNIGTLDTTRAGVPPLMYVCRKGRDACGRVIERLTQARLSRFHTTGAASMQQASNLEDTAHTHAHILACVRRAV